MIDRVWTSNRNIKIVIWLMDHPESLHLPARDLVERLIQLGLYADHKSNTDLTMSVMGYVRNIKDYYEWKSGR